MQRVSVVGSSGSGKSTLGKALAGHLGVPFVELDALNHQPGWVPLPRDEFRAVVDRLAAGDTWVIDGNYSGQVQDIVWSMADTVVWLDLSRAVTMRRVILRTLYRVGTRRKLWNGNRERWRDLLSLDPQQSVIVWTWTTYERRRRRYEALVDDPAWAHLRFIRLRSPRAVQRFLEGIGRCDL